MSKLNDVFGLFCPAFDLSDAEIDRILEKASNIPKHHLFALMGFACGGRELPDPMDIINDLDTYIDKYNSGDFWFYGSEMD